MFVATTRLFITGVSPVTLDDVTSGFNIGDNISLDPAVNSMIGFTGAEVREIIDYYHSAGYLKHEPAYLLELLTKWYGNYLFSVGAKNFSPLHIHMGLFLKY